MKTEFSMDALRSFLEEYNGGNMKETVKSEAVPETQGDVRVVVGETFKVEVRVISAWSCMLIITRLLISHTHSLFVCACDYTGSSE